MIHSYTHKFYFIVISLIFCFSISLQAQTTDCEELIDPLLDYIPDGDPCCGAYISYQVCYQIDSTLIPACPGEEYHLHRFLYPGGEWMGFQTIVGLDAVADTLNQISQNAGVDVTFAYDSEAFSICASGFDTIPAFGEIQFLDCAMSNKIAVNPDIEEINDCPISLPDPADMLSEGTPGDSLFINGLAGNISTGDIIDNITTPVAGGPSANTIGNMINGLIASNLLQNGAGCENINCLEDDLEEQLYSDEWQQGFDMILSDSSGIELPADFDLQAEILTGMNTFFDTIEQNHGGLAGYINELFGFNFSNDPCPEGFGNLTAKPHRDEKPTATANGLLKSGQQTGADLGFFEEAIPGLGEGNPASSSPSPSALALIQSITSGVDLYNGSQSTAIPLHTIAANDISVPIGLNSSNNGLKVDDLGSLVGQNWGLAAGAMVTRIVNGLPDEFDGTVTGMGVGRAHKLRFRAEIPSNIGFALDFPGDDNLVGSLCNPAHRVRTGFGTELNLGTFDFPTDNGVITEAARLDIRWSPLEINMININFSIPIMNILGIFTVRFEFGIKIGVSPNEILSNIIFEENGLGYLYIGDQTKMQQFAELDKLDESYLNELSGSEKLAYLKLIHPNRRFDDNRFLNNMYGNFDSWIESLHRTINNQVPLYETKRIDVQPDEFYFNAGSYSGKFYFNIDQEVIISPPVPGVAIESVIMNGDNIASFVITTPDGLAYTYGRSDFYGVDFTENTNYFLPNFYTYPEHEANRQDFKQAEIDVGMLGYYPIVGHKKFHTYGNTYNRNYKIMDAPAYTSAWHLLSIDSRVTKEEVSFTYELRDSLSYYSNKSYSHTFPNFDINETGIGQHILNTTANEALNFPHIDETKWENGRAEFTYQATQTKLSRWDLASVETNRGERAVFTYDTERAELTGDKLCSKIIIERNNLLYKGWNLAYGIQQQEDPIFICDEFEQEGPSPISASGEAAFALGNLYRPHWYEYYSYFFLNLRIACFTFPSRIPGAIPEDITSFGYRTRLSEFGSLMEIKAYPDPFEQQRYIYDADKESAIFAAEGKRSFLQAVIGIDQDSAQYDFVTSINYIGDGMLPKRFSVHQDVFGYHNDNSLSGSPLPAVTYQSISDQTISSTTAGVYLHFPFYNENAFGGVNSFYHGQNETINFSDVSQGALEQLELASGATITYGYQLNKFPDGSVGAGLRVISKTEDPGDTPARVTTYSYSQPSFNNAPIRIFQKNTDRYFRNLEQKIITTSGVQNQLLPNKNAFIGYGIVLEKWDDIGSVIHHYTTPDNFLDSLALLSDGSLVYNCFYENRNDVNDDDLEVLPEGECEAELDPALQIPSILRQCGTFFGVELHTETRNADNATVQKNQYLYENYDKSRPPRMMVFNSTMNQYNHPGTFGEQFAYRQIEQFLPFALGSIGDLINVLLDLMAGNEIGHPFREIDRYYQTSLQELPLCNLRLIREETTNYPSGGGNNWSTTDYNYYDETDHELTVLQKTTTFSDGIKTKTLYGYAFEENDEILTQYFDGAAVNQLKNIGYLLPLHQKDSVRASAENDFTLVNHSFTALTKSGEKIFPLANYSLQNGVLSLRGYFDGDNGDALPNTYYLAKFGAVMGDGPERFFDPVHLTWTAQRQLLSKRYLDFVSGSYYTDFFEYAGGADYNGIATIYRYDERTRLKEHEAYNGRQLTSYEYNISPGGNAVIASMAFLDGTPTQVTIQNLDGFGKVKNTIRANDGAMLGSAKYDFFWRPWQTTTLGKGTLVNEYEASPLSRLLMTTDDEDNVFEYVYQGGSDGVFYSNTVIDPNGHSITQSYNALDLQLTRLQEGSKTSYNYDNLWRLRSIVNPILEVYEYRYNDMGKLYYQKTPGAGASWSWFDDKYRSVASQDGNGNLYLYEYDEQDRIEHTYLNAVGTVSITTANSIVENLGDIDGGYIPEDLLNTQFYDADGSTFVRYREDRLLVPGTDTSFVIADYEVLDDLGRPTRTNLTYPDADIIETVTFTDAMQITNAHKTITHFDLTLELEETFGFDNVLRPSTHHIGYGNQVNQIASLVYDNEDRLVVKLLGKTHTDDYLQQVDYYYDDIGRIVAINSFGGYECSIGTTICEMGLEFYLKERQISDFECVILEEIEIDGRVHEFQNPVSIFDPDDFSATLAESINIVLDLFGVQGTTSVQNALTESGYFFAVTIENTDALSISLTFKNCAEDFVFTATDCCQVPPPTQADGGENYGLVGDVTDNPDLYYQYMTYDGLDISQIEIGSECFYGQMINNYTYDALHRLTDMQNILFTPDPYAEAFSTNYNYDKAGNITTLKRNGFVGLDPAGAPIFAQIDDLEYKYTGGISSILEGIKDMTIDNDHRLFGVSAPNPTDFLPYGGYDGNGNMTQLNEVAVPEYNILDLPEEMTAPGSSIIQEYVSSGQKYKKVVTADGESTTRYYLSGVEWVDSLPQSYFFGDGRIVWEEVNDTLQAWPQYRIADHLGNSMVFFEDKDEDGLIVTELQSDDPLELEVKQRLWYYPFGMQMEGIGQAIAVPFQSYRYNGKELDQATGLYEYGFRWYAPEIGRFTGVDPIADQFAWVSPFNYAENSPISNIDLHGLQAVHFGQLNRHIGINGSSENFIKKHPVAAVGILAAPAIAATAPATAKGAYIYAATNPEKVTLASQFIWGLGTDEDVPGSGIDDLGRGTRHGIGVLTREAMAGIMGRGPKYLSDFSNISKFSQDIININKSTEGGGVLYTGTAESIVNSASYYSSTLEQGAAIFRGIIGNHLFEDGNKRTGVKALQLFAERTGLKLPSTSSLENTALRLANDEIKSFDDLVNELKR